MRFLPFLALSGLLFAASCDEMSKGVETQHGYRLVNHTKNQGETPKPGDLVRVHVTTFVGDSIMQSTREQSPEPRELMMPDLSQMETGRRVPPLYDGLYMAVKGDSLTIYQKVDSLIEKNLPASLKKEKFVRYEVVLVDVISKEAQQKEQEAAMARFAEVETKANETIKAYTSGGLNDQLVTLPSGLKVLTIEKGNGAALKTGEQVKTHYYGALTSGKMFDNSFQRGEALSFLLGMGQMIPGYDEGTQQLNHGGKAFFFLPYQLGYGEQGTPDGTIPGKAELVFYVEVL
ncbi:MAG: FKBP-type peptidyl-prolyl cis-trans isomerase [Chitinophagales bacterium]|jgi:FKBP-type peptidyl-prolyl cis-trans isomerase FkpA